MRIDTHHHLWDYSAHDYPWIPVESPLHGDFNGDDITNVGGACGITKTIVVQARQTLDENDFLLGIAADTNIVAAVVGWVPLAAANVGEALDHYAKETAFRGVRHVVQGEPDGFLDAEPFNAGIRELKSRNLVYDILIYGRQLAETIRFVDRHPEQPFVLDHIAKPTIKAAEFDADWATEIKKLAERPNVTCKLSGVATEVRDDSWSLETVQPYFDVVLESFGPGRLMFGSDWPVALLATDYARWVETVETLVKPLSEAEQAQIWHKTAEKAYSI